MGKTRKDHRCSFCNGIIPKGTETADLDFDDYSYKTYTVDIKPLYTGRGFGRRYTHPDCAIIRELTGCFNQSSGWGSYFVIERDAFSGRVTFKPNANLPVSIVVETGITEEKKKALWGLRCKGLIDLHYLG